MDSFSVSSYQGKRNILKILLDNGADVNITNPKGTTPLMYANIAERTGDLLVLKSYLKLVQKGYTDIFRKNMLILDEKSHTIKRYKLFDITK